jgi:beta-lactamase regulating signal transducer with metallopeptidase domain
MPPLAPEALGGLTGRLVTLGLVHGLWIGLLAASAAAIALRAIPHRRPRVRYALLLFALGLAALGPPLATGFQRSRAASREAATVALADAPDAAIAVARRGIATPAEGEAPAPTPASPGRAPRAAWGLHAAASRAAAALDAAQPLLLAGWLLIFAALSMLLALGFRATASLRRGARPAGPAIQGRSDDLARRLGLRRGPPVLVHPRLAEPCLCGLARPAILLPGRWLPGADDDRLDAILAHELAHARRFDLHVNFAQRLVESALFFHPAIHWLSRSIRRQRELCADAMAASLTGNPLALARALESVARLRREGRDGAAMSLGAPFGGDAMSLLPRIQELLGMTPTRTPARIWPLAALPASALIALLSASLGLAQSPPAPAPEPRNLPSQRGGLPEGRRFDVIGEAGPRGSDRQICYEVRFVEVEADHWRNRMQGRLRPVEGEPDGSSWILDRGGNSDLVTICQESPTANIFQAPKVTAFEGTHATIVNTSEQLFVADAKPIRTPKSVGFRPEAKAVTIGYTLDLSGDLRPGETLLGIDLRDTSLLAVHDLTRVVESPEGRLAAGYQVPTTIDRQCRLTAPIPEGSTLLVSLGLRESPGRLGGLVKAAVGLLEAAGSPSLVARGATIERLVLITPREIILEDGE